jgi:hypothetical protein
VPGEPLVNHLDGHRGVYELRCAPDGRATFTFAPPVREGNPHVIWRRIGDMRCSIGRSAIAGLIGVLRRISASAAQR